jgi:hypothetical protein
MNNTTIINKEDLEDFNNWIKEGNAVKIGANIYIEQTTQYKKHFSLDELKQFYIKEYL